MPRINTLVLAGLVALSVAHLASAQTANVTRLAVQSGNGQVACICVTATLQGYQPITVKATDVNGNPVAGATVTWSVTSGQMTLSAVTTTTAGDGTTSNAISLVVLNNFTSSAVPYLVATIQALSNGNAVTFTETQSLITQQGSSVIQANPPTYNGNNLSEATLTANVGTTLSTPIDILVAGLNTASNGVANAAVRFINNQTSPTISCAYPGGYADPGSVLSSPQGNAVCYPTFTGSGTGTFYVSVGGVPSSNFATALYLQYYGPYTFTSVPGAPAAVQIISGNNQVGNVGQAISPLVAKLVDANGNAIQGDTMVWSVVPAGAVALTNSVATTDSNGLISIAVTLDQLAASGAQVTVALQSNTSISATFQLTLASALTALNKISGDVQSAQENTNFNSPLVVQVLGASGPVQNYPVQFITNGPVSLVGSTTVTTNASGEVSVTVKAGAVTGTATVTAVAGVLNQTFNLTITSTPTGPAPNGISISGGNNQTAIVNTAFASPLIVTVNSSSGPVSGYTVNFSTTGPISLSTAAATTNSSGQAQVSITAGAATGAATVVASISGYSQTFNLTVVPQGPNLTANSFLNAASRQVGALSPCSLAIVSAAGLTPDGISDLGPAPVVGRFPKSLHNLTITVAGVPAPIVNVAMGTVNPEVTFQVPCEVTPGSSVPVIVNVNGGGTATVSITIQTVSPGIFQTVMSDGVSRAVAVRDDGSFADIGGADIYDPTNPVRLGENVRFYLTGMGATIPQVGTDSIQNPNADLVGHDAVIAGVVQAGIVGFGGMQVVSARQAPGLIGVYEVQVLIPSNAPTGNNVPISIAVVPVGSSSSTPGVSSPNSTVPIGQ